MLLAVVWSTECGHTGAVHCEKWMVMVVAWESGHIYVDHKNWMHMNVELYGQAF